MAEKENEKRKLRAELDKARKQRDILEQKAPNLESTIGDLQSMVEKLSKDIEKETKKREQANRDKDAAQEKLRAYTEVYERLNIADPLQFMQDFEFMKTEVDNMSEKIAEKSKLLQARDAKFK